MNVGDVVGSYRITRVIGEGGMGVVYLGSHTLLGREAAIKVLLPSLSNKQDVVQRFFNEAKTTTSIKHPGIVEIYDFGYTEEGHAFIVMEHLEGETLDARIQRLGNMPAVVALPMLAQVARALGAAHELDVVHRDLKPENIYIVSDPEVTGGERTKILDFGIAKLRNAGNVGVRTASGQVMGPPGYMAPEQCLGASEVDPRADIYALGCILFDMLCGRPPFESANFADVLAAHVSKEPPAPSSLVSSISPKVDALIAELLQKAPESRPQSVAEVLARIDALMKALAGERAAKASRPPPIPPAARKKARPSSVEVAPELLDSRAPLPPLPRPQGAGTSPPPRAKAKSIPPPVPRADANARTLYESDPSTAQPQPPKPAAKDPALAATMGPAQPPPRPAKDPALAATMAAPVMARPAQPGAPVPQTTLPLGAQLPPQPQPQPRPQQPQQPMRPMQPPQSMQPMPQPMQPMQPPMSQSVGPHGTFAQAPADQMQPRSPQPAPVAFNDPVYANRPVQAPPDPARAAAIDPRVMQPGPRAVAEPPKSGGLMLPIALILIVGAAGGGFFLYRQMTSSEQASSEVDAAAVAVNDPPAADAGAPVTSVDAAPARAIDAAAIPALAADGGAAAPAGPDAAAPLTPDAAAASAPPSVEPGSGRVIDPALGASTDVPTVTLKITSRPGGASVVRTYDKLALGKTPLEYVTKKFNANEEFLVELPGHFPVKTKISTNRDGARQVVLLKKPK